MLAYVKALKPDSTTSESASACAVPKPHLVDRLPVVVSAPDLKSVCSVLHPQQRVLHPCYAYYAHSRDVGLEPLDDAPPFLSCEVDREEIFRRSTSAYPVVWEFNRCFGRVHAEVKPSRFGPRGALLVGTGVIRLFLPHGFVGGGARCGD